MKNAKRIIKGILLSVTSLTIAFLAIAIPFKLIGEVESFQLRTLFLIEIAVYFVCSMIFLTLSEKKKAKKVRENEKRLIRREKFQKAQEEYYSLAA